MAPVISRRDVLRIGLGLMVAGVAGCTGESPVTGLSGVPGSGSPPSSILPSRQSTQAVATPTSSPAALGSSAPPVAASSALPAPTTSPLDTGSAGPATEIGTGPSDRPIVALTFHGGGDPATATAILDICSQRGARITVMAIGTWLAANPSLAGAVLGGGHDLGNHTWSHPVLSDLSQSEVRDEITRCRDLLVNLTGSPGAFFRTSSGQHASSLILQEAGTAGYPVCLSYDVDPEDWTDPGAAAVRSGATAAVAGSIVSLHLGHSGTVQALPGILDDLQARGLQAVTASTLLGS